MIYVKGVPLFTDDSSSSFEGRDMLIALLEHPDLIAASRSFTDIPERKFTASEESRAQRYTQPKCVYVFQREYAIADPALVEFVGTDEATTCIGIAIRNCKSGMTSIAHLDSPNIVDMGLAQMLALVSDPDGDAVLDVHLIGAFEDAAIQERNNDTKSKRYSKMDGYSFPLCIKLVEALSKSRVNFQIQNFQVLKHNTRWDSDGNAYPVFHGFLIETSSGSVVPACFDRSTRCPDEIVRRIRIGASFRDPRWAGRLLETYETRMDRFVIAACSWTIDQVHTALVMRHLSDPELLLATSTSPSAEGPDFVDTQRRVFEYLIKHPDWRETFPSNKPRVFERTASGRWTMNSSRSSFHESCCRTD